MLGFVPSTALRVLPDASASTLMDSELAWMDRELERAIWTTTQKMFVKRPLGAWHRIADAAELYAMMFS